MKTNAFPAFELVGVLLVGALCLGSGTAATAMASSGYISSAGLSPADIRSPDQIEIRDPWVAEVLPSRTATAAYLVIENLGDSDDALVAVQCEAAEVAELHTMERQGEMMRMRKVNRIDVPAGATVELKPGSFHIMLFDLDQQLKAGDEVELGLRFESGKEMSLIAPVRKREARPR